jgi:hypothetical protein
MGMVLRPKPRSPDPRANVIERLAARLQQHAAKPLLLPDPLSYLIARLAACLQKRSAERLPQLLSGVLLASGRRTCTSWFRAGGIAADFRPAYSTIWACGRNSPLQATVVLDAVEDLLPGKRLVLAIDDSPTKRYGPCIEGAGIHHNPTPGPAGGKHLYGHVWVSLAAIAKHPDCGTLALPLLGKMYVRKKDVAQLDPDHRIDFFTKLQLAGQLLDWVTLWCDGRFQEFWYLVDGGYSKRPFLKAAAAAQKRLSAAAAPKQVVVVGRLPCNAALYDLPEPPAPHQRGRKPIYGKHRQVLHLRAGQPRGWQEVECEQYDATVKKTVKTFLATWKPARGVIRVVLVKEEDGWRAYFCTKADASVAEILEAVADRGALEQTFKDVKEVWGAAQQQVRNLQANVGCWNINGWMYSLVEVWAWEQEEEDLSDRSDSPWDNKPRRPSHADKRKALQHAILEEEITEALRGRPTKAEMRALAERLLTLAL